MKRKMFTVLAVLGLVVAASGCSLREVQLFFQIKGHPVTADQAKTLADLANQKQAAGCDARYAPGASTSSSCVPNNVTSVHCAGTTGDGPAVRGPLTLTGWDSFGLDPDGDKQACVDPVGNVEQVGQVFDHIEVQGWAFDPNTTDPISVDVYDNGVGARSTASVPRSDIASSFPGSGGSHGFDISADVDGTIGTRNVCTYAINVGAGGNQQLQCKAVQVRLFGAQNLNFGAGDRVLGMIEGADRVPGGIHVRGWIFDIDTPTSQPPTGISYNSAGPSLTTTGLTTINRQDVTDGFNSVLDPGDTPFPAGSAHGFDFIATSGGTTNAGDVSASQQVCLFTGPGTTTPLMCRDLDT